ncbi:MAG: ABC transporter ATP-binding protein [Nitrospirae bacterium]|nr:MAG: ABC transporter ATP-binding protein [Nitrospirota bacterium]
MDYILQAEGISKSFGGLEAVKDVSFRVPRGSIKALIGPNGAGKTTLFNIISGQIRPDKGEIIFGNTPLQGLPPHRIARAGIARTFQQINLFHGMTVLENVMVGLHNHTETGFIAGMLNLPSSRRDNRFARQEALGVLERLGIAELANREATSLAYGQQRIVEIARALAQRPGLLLLDEPAAGLNIKETAELGRLITEIRNSGITVFIVEHDMSLVMKISDEIMVLSYGEKIAEGSPLEIQKNEEVVRVYLGE